MARELDIDADPCASVRQRSLSPAYNVIQTPRKAERAGNAVTRRKGCVFESCDHRMPADYSDSCLFYLLISNVWPGVITNSGLWATRYRWGRKLAVGMTSAGLAAALSVDPEASRYVGEGISDPWEAVYLRQPPLPPSGGDFAIALGLALGKAY